VVKHDWLRLSSEEFVCSAAASGPQSVVIQHNDAALDYLSVQMLETNPRGCVPIAIKAQKRDFTDFGSRQGFLKPTYMIMNEIRWIADLFFE
jgi:hypothetical protein